MTSQTSAEWLARGRTHQIAGRAVDAMLCFRRALRESPQDVDARLHLGEVLRDLGRLPDAIASWTDATRIAPEHAESRRVLAEALLSVGEWRAAADAANAILTLDRDDVRAQSIAAIATLWSGNDADASRLLCAAVARDAEFLSNAAIAQSLALWLDREPNSETATSIVDAIIDADIDAIRAAKVPAALMSCVFDRLQKRPDVSFEMLRKWIDAVVARSWTPVDHNALRRIAYAVASIAPNESAELARLYAGLCLRIDRTGAPILWSRRTAGAKLRVVILANNSVIASETRARVESLPEDRYDVRAIHADRDKVTARSIAESDADVIVDLGGHAANFGPILAMRPARLRITLATLPAHHHPPLIDRVVSDLHDLIATLKELQLSIANADSSPLDAAKTAELWKSGVDAHRGADRTAARRYYRRLLESQPDFAPARYLLGMALHEDGEINEARDEFAAAIRAAPSYVAAWVDAVRAAIDAGDAATAEALATKAIASIDDAPPSLLRALGSAQLAVHDGAGAVTAFEQALRLEPIDGETHYNHGVALQMERRYGDAARAYQRALAFNPDLFAADFNLGTIFAEQGNRDAAIAAFSAVLARNPDHVAAYKHRSELLLAAGRIEEWLTNFRDFEAHCKDALPLAATALEVLQYCGDFDGVERYLEGLRKERFKSRDANELVDSLEELLYLLLYFDVEPELFARLAETYDHAARSVYGESLHRRVDRRSGKIRIGYLSADFRNHVMGKMIWQAIRHHDVERFEIVLYSTSAERDDWTARFESLGYRFEGLAVLTDRQAAERLAADDLDLLIDLSTHTKGARPGILALKPARIQITHVASAGTVGLSTIDFKLTDGYADVAENQRYQIEALLPMEGCVYPYRHIEPEMRAPPRREALGIARDAVVIGAFVSALKLSRRCLALWRQILERVPHARIAFSPINAALAPLYIRLVGAAGIDPRRVVFVAQSPSDAENQARYSIVDFVLDPMPYGGVNGTLEALDMGVPVVTLVGKRHAERTSYSILSNLGVPQTIARSGPEYVSIATRLASDRRFMSEVRGAIRAGLVSSPLTDMLAHTRHLEDAYMEALRKKASGISTSVEKVTES